MTFYLSIVLYITSVILALALMIIGKGMNRKRFLSLTTIHIFAGISCVLIGLLRKDGPSESSPDYFFMTYICTGTCLCGLAWRTAIWKALRYYLTLFALSFPLFLFSPSMLVNFLLTGHYTGTLGKKYHLGSNLYLEQQNSWAGKEADQRYKVVRHRGIFHQTIARDIDFGGRIDSIVVLSFSEKDTTRIRGFMIKETFVSTEIDSLDVSVPMTVTKRNNIERRL